MQRLVDCVGRMGGLTLSRCAVSDTSAAMLFKVSSVRRGKKKLTLNHQAVGRCATLTKFCVLDSVGLSKEAADGFSEALQQNVFLVDVIIGPGGPDLSELLKQNAQVRACMDGTETKLSLVKRGLTWDVPLAVFSLSNLTRLDLSNNKLTSLSPEMRKLSSLLDLILRSNELTDLPGELIYIRRLRVLDVQDNLLRRVPLCISWLNDVEVVNLRGNLICKEPAEAIGALERLRDFDLSQQKCDMSQLPKKMPTRGEALVAWCKERLNAVQPARVRVVVLGEPKSGKTSLVEALRAVAGKGDLREEVVAFAAETEGVALSNVSLAAKNLELKFWDFRSSLSWAANQAFFTNGAIYLICFDLRESIDHSNIGFWLSLVVSRAPRARIYLCGTHLDDAICDRARIDAFCNMLQTNFMDRIANVRELLMVSSTTHKNAKDLLNAIVRGSMAVRQAQMDTMGAAESTTAMKSKLLRNISSKFRKMSVVYKQPPLIGARTPNGSLRGPGSEGSDESLRTTSPEQSSESDSLDGRGQGSAASPPSDDLDKGVPPSFLVFEQKLFALRLAVNPPVIKWSQFEGLAVHTGITTREGLLSVAEYLQDLGSIIYFTGSEEASTKKDPGSLKKIRTSTSGGVAARQRGTGTSSSLGSAEIEDVVILDMRWLMKVFTSVTGWTSSFVGQIETSALMTEWDAQPLVFPPSLRQPLFWLLERFEVMFSTPGSLVFAPCLLDATRAANFDTWWPQKTPSDLALICRVYNFDFLPLGFGGRFLGSVLRMGWKALSGWKNGMVFVKDGERLLVEINPSQHSLRVNIRYPTAKGCSATLGPLAESLSTLIRDSLQTGVRVDVPCLHCLAAGAYDYYVFDLEELSALMADGDYFAYCRSIHPVRIYTMAPDISVEGLDSHVIPFSSIEKGEKLGEGSFSIVYRGTWRNQAVAVKMMNIDDKLDTAEKRKVFSEWRREVETMRSLFHPNIVAMRGVCLDPICMILDMCSAGDLYHFLADKTKDVHWKLRLQIAADVAAGMSFLHSVTPPVIHRDLKSPNVLLHRLQSGDMCAKVADFGLSVRFGLVTEIKGSAVENPVWTAPEVIKGETYDEKCDVYSYGVILWELLTRQNFFGEIKWISEIERLVKEGQRPAIPADCPRLYEGLVTRCWSNVSTERLAFQQIVPVLNKISEMLGLGSDASSAAARALEQPAQPEGEQRSRNVSGQRLDAPKQMVKTGVEILTDGKGQGMEEHEVAVMTSESDGQTDSGGGVAGGGSGFSGPGLSRSPAESLFRYEFKLVLAHDGQIECMLHLCCDGVDTLWSGDNDGYVQVFNLSTRTLLHRFQAHNSGVLCMIVQGTKAVWTSSRDGSIKIWGWSNKCGSVESVKTVRKPSKRGNAVTCMICEHGVVICGNTNGRIVAFRGSRFKKQLLSQAQASVSCIVVSHGLIWVGVGDAIFCTSGEDSAKSFVLRGHVGPVHQLLRVGQTVWSVSSDKTCMIWTVKGGVPRCLDVLQGHASRIFAATTDGSKFVWTAGWDKTIIVWNWATHKFTKSMEVRHDDAISVLVWVGKVGMAKEDMLISGSWDGRIILWVSRAEEEGKAVVKVSKSVSDHWGGVVLGQNVADHWGLAPPPVAKDVANASSPEEAAVDNIGKGLRMLGRSPSRSSLPSRDNAVLPGDRSPVESPRGTGSSSPFQKGSYPIGRQLRRPGSVHENVGSGFGLTKSRSGSTETLKK